MPLGAAKTKKYKIGTAEMRIGPLASANKLIQAHSLGVLDNVTVEVTQNSVNLEGGFPKTIFDTAIVSQNVVVTGNMREYSRRNLSVLLGGSVSASEPTDAVGTASTDTTAGATSVPLGTGDGANFTEGDIVVVYPEGKPHLVSVCLIDAIATDTLTLDAGTPTLVDYAGTTDTIHVFNAQQVAIGDISQTNYFSLSVIESERATGRPIGFAFWKATLASGVTLGSNSDDFAATDFVANVIQPAASEYAAGQPLNHLANVIPTHPTGMYYAGAD
jgi:hypothetical protein